MSLRQKLGTSGRKGLVLLIFFISFFCSGCGSTQFPFVRDSKRISHRSETETVYHLYVAIHTKYGIENSGKFPQAKWEDILPYMDSPKPSGSLLKRIIYNDIYADESEIEDKSLPMLVIFRPDGNRMNLSISFEGEKRWLSDKEILELRPDLSPRASIVVEQFLLNHQ